MSVSSPGAAASDRAVPRPICQSGPWLRQLQADEATSACPQFTCWYSNADNIVFPASTATLPGADNRHIAGVPHVAMAFHPKVMADTLKLL